MTRVSKILSANDIGTTGAHQAGIHVPKVSHLLSFFPTLPVAEKNPRATLVVREKQTGERWDFSYIYYNNRAFGGTRDEYRLTRMTRFLREIAAREGDELAFIRQDDGSIVVELLRNASANREPDAEGVLRLGSGWIYIHR